MKNVRRAVITAAGYSSRFLPITKAIPKEMLPIGDRPVIHYILKELEDAGITEVLILIGRGRECLLNYLDKNYEIDDYLSKTKNKVKTNFFPNLNIYYRRVPLPRGVADCLMYAKNFVGQDPFILAYSDDVFFEGNPCKELISMHKRNEKSGIICSLVTPENAHKYGIVSRSGMICEKPRKPETNLAVVGRYLLAPGFFDILDFDIIGALNKLKLNIITTKAKRFDAGNKEGLFEAFQYIMSQN